MKSKGKASYAALFITAAAGLDSVSAAVYALSDFTRPAAGAALTTSFDFVTNDGWSGTPPNAISGEESVYLTMTVSWTTAANIGTFQARFNVNDDGGGPRWGVGKNAGGTSGFEFVTANTTTDRDGSGPATARPTITAINTNTINSVTLVLKVDQLQAAITPPNYPDQPLPVQYDRWYGDIADQTQAAGFMWINPNLAATEASQPTVWAAWRSGNTTYQGVSFITDTADVNLNFSNIAIYTGTDTPFAAVPEPTSALLGGLGLLALLRRRRA